VLILIMWISLWFYNDVKVVSFKGRIEIYRAIISSFLFVASHFHLHSSSCEGKVDFQCKNVATYAVKSQNALLRLSAVIIRDHQIIMRSWKKSLLMKNCQWLVDNEWVCTLFFDFRRSCMSILSILDKLYVIYHS
jgi:hypothetical protein